MELRLSARGRRQVGWLLNVAAVVGVAIGIVALVRHLVDDPLADVRAYYDAGARLNAGEPLYVQPADTNDPSFYRYPPLLAILFRPLALLPFETAAVIWEVVVIAAFVGTVVRLGPRRRSTWLAVAILAAPIAWTLVIGQAQSIVTFLMALGLPWAVMLAANLKLFPALAAVWWLGRRDWPALGQFVLVGLGLVAFQLIIEPTGTLAFPGFVGLDQVGEVANLSPYAMSPLLWAALVVALGLLALLLARTRYGWAAAVTFSVLATPRLLLYQLSTLLAGVREPDSARPTVEEEAT